MLLEACLLGACVVSAEITHADYYEPEWLPTTAYSYDGTPRDISKFYKVQNDPLYIRGHVILDTNTKLGAAYDSGVKTQKMTIAESVEIDIKQYQQLNHNVSITYGGGVKLGGKTKHMPCTDDYNREYYCGDLTAWSDFKPEEQSGFHYKLSGRLTYTFD